MSVILIIILNLFFTIWANQNGGWYIFILNYILIFFSSSLINTAYIQGITRGYSYIYLFGVKGIFKAITINILTLLYFLLSFVIVKYVFFSTEQIIIFFISCISLSTFVAIVDGMFNTAIKRTIAIEGNIPFEEKLRMIDSPKNNFF